MPQDSSHRVALIVDSGSNPFEMGVATELFGLRRPEIDRTWYTLTVCSATPSAPVHLGLFTLSDLAGLDAAAEEADTVIVPNRPDPWVPPRPEVIEAVRSAHGRGARLVSFCTGAFTLAAAGVLDGRRAATHWRHEELFARLYPRVRLERDVLFVDEGDVLTAAGSVAALDLGLHLIRRDHGAEAASSVSRRLVFTAHREGGQRQFVPVPVPESTDVSLAPLLEWARERLGDPLTVADLAVRVAVSQATLHRRFRAELGTTPLAWLRAERVLAARRLLEGTELDLAAVARASGLGTTANLRQAVRAHTGLSPSAYRSGFRLTRPTAPSPRPRAGDRGPTGHSRV
ncbi:helix-turn-helix domain-containing protein [Nocardiopsis lambiniae]|uniref:Helix-turn-helix domain-containing protein n=1 Tax=Nocardiopsis lambiniae TaxID=3075539 RepID=A0ABU2MAC7_9ACTN|nr:helix-turn-helix domain-containing protein [Nocardiopsis sp. DSM 44743]MDT0329545.1 helix-turn-helix domain-containing protein [Nocardiopsis sp. DSM 44743]